ncbi:hypothetical protein quinque_005923 [Culex quinquefasciatus]
MELKSRRPAAVGMRRRLWWITMTMIWAMLVMGFATHPVKETINSCVPSKRRRSGQFKICDRAHLCHQFAPAMSTGATKNRPRTVNPEDDVDED